MISAKYPNCHLHIETAQQDFIPPEKWVILNSTKPSALSIESLSNPLSKNIFLQAGIHPWFIPHTKEEQFVCLNKLQNAAEQKTIRGIGECGLDLSTKWITNQYHSSDIQEEILLKQLKIAKQYNLPITLHTVHCNDLLIQILKEFAPTFPIIFHQFNNSLPFQKQLLRHCNGYFSFSPAIIRASKKARESWLKCPNQRILLEDEKELSDTSLQLKELYEITAYRRKIKQKSLIKTIKDNINSIFEITSDID